MGCDSYRYAGKKVFKNGAKNNAKNSEPFVVEQKFLSSKLPKFRFQVVHGNLPACMMRSCQVQGGHNHTLTSVICGNSAMHTGRENPKLAQHTTT